MNLEPLALAIGCIQERVKVDIASEFIRHAYGALSPGNPHHWDRDGFYTARDCVELLPHGYPIPPGEQEFPVPAGCPYWSTAFFEGSQLLRGFLRRAWLDMPGAESTGVLAIATRDGATRISARVDGRLLEPLAACQPLGTTLLWRLGEANPHGVLHLQCDAPVAFSAQLGRVSCVVGKPFWYRPIPHPTDSRPPR